VPSFNDLPSVIVLITDQILNDSLVVLKKIQLMFMYMHMGTIYSALNNPDQFV